MDPFENLIEDIYSAASNPDEWRAVMRHVASAANARECAIQGATLADGAWIPNFILGYEIGPSDAMRHTDLVVQVGDPRLQAAIDVPIDHTYQERDFISETAIRAHPYYQELCVPLDMLYMCGVPALKVEVEGGLFFGGFALQHSPRQGPIHGESMRVWDTIRPHLTRAMRLAWRLGTISDRGWFNKSSDVARFTIDRSGRVTSRNELGEQALARNIARIDADGRLSFLNHRLNARVQHGLFEELLGKRRIPLSGSVVESHCTWRYYMLPLQSATTLEIQPHGKPPFVNLFVEQIVTGLQSPSRLSPAESKIVARLAGGEKLRDIAAAQGVSYETVRSQCKNAMRKLEVRSQAAMVAVWLRSRFDAHTN